MRILMLTNTYPPVVSGVARSIVAFDREFRRRNHETLIIAPEADEPTDDAPRPALNGTGPGELSYITYEVTDSAAVKQFYGRVLHWTFEPGRIADQDYRHTYQLP